MTHADAIELIKNCIGHSDQSVQWVDLGSGSGTFTKALADLLPDGSTITAIDQTDHQINSPNAAVTIEFLHADFTIQNVIPANLDGIIIANALHYVSDQRGLLQRLSTHLKKNGCLIVIEYDTDRSNPWVPYPLTFERLHDLLRLSGFSEITKVSERNSVYNASTMYAAVAFSGR